VLWPNGIVAVLGPRLGGPRQALVCHSGGMRIWNHPGRRRWTPRRATLLWAAACLAVLMALISATACSGSEPLGSSTTTSAPQQIISSTSSTSAPGDASTTTSEGAASGELQVHFIDVGQGDSTLIISPDGKVMLIDGGEADSGALAYLQAHGIDHVDVMVATHPDKDHIGGLVEVLHALPVAQVVTNGEADTGKTYEGFLGAIEEAEAVPAEVKRGDQLHLGSLTLTVLNPGGSLTGDLDEDSLVLRLAYGKTSFLFTGDAGGGAEADMLASGEELSADILKVGHHGSSTSSSPAFLAAVRPRVAVYSADGKSSEHPSKKTIAALADVGCQVYGTDVNGSVVVTSDGTTSRVTP
jgi:competence protein ComEC